MEPFEKRRLIHNLRNQLKIERLELFEFEKKVFALMQQKHKMQADCDDRARYIDKLEREWFYESGRVKKIEPPKRKKPSVASLAKEFGISTFEAAEIIKAEVERRG
jgi:hypothetical protein